MRALFIAPGPNLWVSHRIRCAWPARYMAGADVITINEFVKLDGRLPIEYDAYIFQKCGMVEAQIELLAAGKRVWWDVCDPVWWFNPHSSLEVMRHCTGVVASNIPLARDFEDWSGKKCEVIPDRLELDHFPIQRMEHKTNGVTRFIWYGSYQNRISINSALAYLERLTVNGHDISLTIMDNKPNAKQEIFTPYPVYFTKWVLRLENRIIANHDIAILPPYPGPWSELKSNNKNLTAWACGLPDTDGQDYDELITLVTSDSARESCALAGHRKLYDDYQVEKSAREWESLLWD